MAVAVVSGASCMCTMGTAPGVINATSQAIVLICGIPAATITDVAPMASVMPCGLCVSMANPATASATAAALGVLTPQPCVPVPAGVWMGGPTPLIGGAPGLANDAKLICSYGGSISITIPGQTAVIFQ
ncbi:MAG: DUF4280 domain-containing protein [Oscillospiraceae bacterium]|nr:DUF4280 domain-containing protein [Oscillospiraceae bacterium]